MHRNPLLLCRTDPRLRSLPSGWPLGKTRRRPYLEKDSICENIVNAACHLVTYSTHPCPPDRRPKKCYLPSATTVIWSFQQGGSVSQPRPIETNRLDAGSSLCSASRALRATDTNYTGIRKKSANKYLMIIGAPQRSSMTLPSWHTNT